MEEIAIVNINSVICNHIAKKYEINIKSDYKIITKDFMFTDVYMFLEDEYKIELKDHELLEVESVYDLAKLVYKTMGNKQ